MARILGKEGSIPWVLGMFSKGVVQAVLIFVSETWVMTPNMGRSLGIFQNVVARRITGKHPKQQLDESWDYPPLETEMEGAAFE